MSTGAGWDCHAHLFGPYDSFPLAAERSYTPPEATEAGYLALLGKLGLAHGVLVHPSAYAEDHSLLLHALSRNRSLRGVIVTRAASASDLTGLRGKGIRGARFSHRSGAGANFAGSASFDDLVRMAGSLGDAGLHAELWTDCRALPDIAPRLATLPVPVVVDHMGGFDVRAGIDDPGFRVLLGLLERGKVWVKMCAYRNLLGTAGAEDDGRPFHDILLAANPTQLVWGSDWPHLRVDPAPDTAQLLQRFRHWTADDALVEQILLHAPSALYA